MALYFSRVRTQKFRNVTTVGTCVDANNTGADATASSKTAAAIVFANECKRRSARKRSHGTSDGLDR